MNTFHREHLHNIQRLFEEKTGTALPAPSRRPVRMAVLLAAALAGVLVMTASAVRLFSSLSGDDLALSAVYEGAGVVSIQVENRSEVDLCFQPVLKLMRWSTGQEVAPLSERIVFRNREVPAGTSAAMTVDLSQAYDLAQLETPLPEEDHYYLLLTNNDFTFGQDWMCPVAFADPVPAAREDPAPAAPAGAAPALPAGIPQALRPYFETCPPDIDQRLQQNEAYLALCGQLLEQAPGGVISPVSPLDLTVGDPAGPVVFDPALPQDSQLQLTGLHRRTLDGYGKIIGSSDTDRALVISAYLPQREGEADGGADLPLRYLFIYEAAGAETPQACAFVRGQLIPFEEMEAYQIYEDAQYICYDMTDLFYTDLRQYTESMIAQLGRVFFDEQIWDRVQNINAYYREHLPSLLRRTES